MSVHLCIRSVEVRGVYVCVGSNSLCVCRFMALYRTVCGVYVEVYFYVRVHALVSVVVYVCVCLMCTVKAEP